MKCRKENPGSEMVTIFQEAGLSVSDRGALGIGDLEYVVAVAPCSESSGSFTPMQERDEII